MKVRSWLAALSLVAGLVGGPALADDGQTVRAGALSMKAPKAWQAERPSNAMRKAQIKVPPAAGDPEPAELVVTAFAGGAGSLEANIRRWEGQFQGEGGRAPKAKTETRKGKNVEYTRVEVAGKYAGMAMPGQPAAEAKSDYRLLGAIVATPETTYYLKLTGPDKTVAATAKDFDAMLDSLSVDQ